MITPAPPPPNGKPVYVRLAFGPYTLRVVGKHRNRTILEQGMASERLQGKRNPKTLFRAIIADALHKKGYAVQPEPTPECIELDVEIWRFWFSQQRITDNSGIGLLGLVVPAGGGEVVYIDDFHVEAMITGPIFENSRYGFVGANLRRNRGQSVKEISEEGVTKFRKLLDWKIPHRDAKSKGPVLSRSEVVEQNAAEKRAVRIETDFARFHQLRAGAIRGNAEAQSQLANVLAALPEANKWYRAAAAQGDKNSMYSLFRRTQRARESDDANKWLRSAALHGHVGAQAFLASMFLDRPKGPVVEQIYFMWCNQRDNRQLSEQFQPDNSMAYAWLTLAVAQTNKNNDAGEPEAGSELHWMPNSLSSLNANRNALGKLMSESEIVEAVKLSRDLSIQIIQNTGA